MNRLRSIAIDEQRQLATFVLAVVVFVLTLVALQLRDRGPASDGSGGAVRVGASRVAPSLGIAGQ